MLIKETQLSNETITIDDNHCLMNVIDRTAYHVSLEGHFKQCEIIAVKPLQPQLLWRDGSF